MRRLAPLVLILSLLLLAPPSAEAAPWLKWGRAKRAAKRYAYNHLPMVPDKWGVSWCNRWHARRIDCGTYGRTYKFDYDLQDYTVGRECTVTVVVKLSRFGRLRARGDHDTSCF